jgi:hypothetical protein
MSRKQAKTRKKAPVASTDCYQTILAERTNRLRKGDKLYHYCPADAALSILEKGTIRFSDIKVLNDAEEGVWGYQVFQEAVRRIAERQDLPPRFPVIKTEFFDAIESVWTTISGISRPFLASFSLSGDSLSQWRAYADDGRGFAIGFGIAAFRQMPCHLLTVLYDRDAQVSETILSIGKIHKIFKNSANLACLPFVEHAYALMGKSVSFKNPAFRDEHEVRSLHMVGALINDNCWKLQDLGGYIGEQMVQGHPVGFQVRKGGIVAYLDIPFSPDRTAAAIEEIVLGPKCGNTPEDMNFILGNLGYGILPIRRAGVAYR